VVIPVKKHILETIGNTPLVKINRLNKNSKVNIYAKLEGFNPSGSIKDRIALRMIEHAEQTGKLNKNSVIIEATSGNTGIGLAMVSAVKGYKFVAVMSESVSVERRKILRAYGAEIILTSAQDGTDGAIRKVRSILKEDPDKYFNPDQFSNENNYLAHYQTAEEIISQLNGKIDVFIASKGTTGTLIGISKRLKKFNQNIRVIGVEPFPKHKIQGLKNLKESIIPKIYNSEIIDKTIFIEDKNAFQTTKDLARIEGIFAGMSSGASMYVALQIAKKMSSGNIIVILPDRGEKYLSTNLFN
jgi:S-sulfo-L-cysteine synthase (O-acetyl-L-serine-dependent)